MSDWEDRDWQDYNSVPDRDSDPLAGLFNDMPFLDASNIDRLLSNLPIPTISHGAVPEMTVEEAIEVCGMPVNMYHAIYRAI